MVPHKNRVKITAHARHIRINAAFAVILLVYPAPIAWIQSFFFIHTAICYIFIAFELQQ